MAAGPCWTAARSPRPARLRQASPGHDRRRDRGISTQTRRPLQTLLAERAAHFSDAGWYITICLLPSIDRTGDHLLVSCNQFGRLDRGRIAPLPGAVPPTAVAAW